MKMRRFLTAAILALMGCASCSVWESEPSVSGGSIRIHLSSGEIRTRAVGDGVVADGGGIYINAGVPDLVILLADSNGDIIKTYPGSDAILQADPTATEMAVTFTGLTNASDEVHTVYAFANTAGLWAMESGGSAVTDLTALTTASSVEALRFTALAADTAPELTNNRLPMSAKGTVVVSSSHNGEVSLEMIRCVAKVTIDFVNNTGAALRLDGFNFSIENLCPDRGFVTPHDLPDVPTGINYGDIVKNVGDNVTFTYDEVNERGETKPYTFFVFPGTAPGGEYLLNASFTANGAAEASSFTGLPVHDDHAVNITSLERNQHLHIVTRISKGLTVSFNFEVKDWEARTETVTFD